jgi:two-component system NtrC family sensor kinase
MTPNLPFDREVGLAELLRAVPRAKLEAALSLILGPAWRLTDRSGAPVLEAGAPPAEAASVPVQLELEAIGHLHGPAGGGAELHRAARWLELVLASAHRYRMAADLHFEAVHADYEALQRKHAELQASELRFRALSAQLEQRVKDQVEVIGRSERALYQSAKLASIGSLAAGMAHEINNPIGFIGSNLGMAGTYLDQLGQTLQAYAQRDAERAERLWRNYDVDFILADCAALIAESSTGAERISNIVANLKHYAGAIDAPLAGFDPNEAVRAATAVIEDQLPAGARLATELQPLPALVGDRAALQQALLALLQNACAALGPAGGLIRVSSRLAGDLVRLSVNDNGSGIAEAIRARIFDPFFTTRSVGQGMGLGLTVCHDIVRAHRGSIEVDSVVGAGTTVTICLPINGSALTFQATV